MRTSSIRFLAVPVALALVALAAPVASASIEATASLGDAVNGQLLDDDFDDGPAGFTFAAFDEAGNPRMVVAYDTRLGTNNDPDLDAGGTAIGEPILVIEQEPGNEAPGNGLECECIPDDDIGGIVQIRYNSPVHSWISNFVDVEPAEGPETTLSFIDTATGTTSEVAFEQLIDPASVFYQGPAFIFGDGLGQVMTEPITAAVLGHTFDLVLFDKAGSEALGTFTHVVGEISVGSTVFHDVDDDGVQDAGEPGIPGITVELLDGAGAVVNTTTTDGAGDYYFDTDAAGGALLEGSYSLRVTPTATYPRVSSAATPADAGVDGTNDATQAAPGDPAVTGSFTLLLNDNPTGADESFQGGDQDDGPFDADGDMTIDVGLVGPVEPLAGLGDFVWFDDDEDGIQDEGEIGVAGITVNLWTDDDGDGLPDTQIATTTTAIDGSYRFDELDPDLTYVVQFDSSRLTTRDAGDDDTVDSDPDPTTGITGPIELDPGEFDPTIDAGIIPPTEPRPAVGSTVFFDEDDDGVQDAGEPGIAGVTVELLDEADVVVNTTVTDGSGNYFFDDDAAGAPLPEGDYRVRVTPPSFAPDVSSTLTPADDGVDGTNDASQTASGAPAVTGLFTLTLGTSPAGADESFQGGDQDDALLPDIRDEDGDMTIDVGFVGEPPVRLGDYVWFDADEDGVQDADEDGVEGVTVNLWTDDDDDGAPDTQLSSTTTDEDGLYIFEGLDRDLTYVVQFVTPGLTQQDAGDDDTVDSDPDPATGITGPIVFPPDADEDLTIDAGIIPAALGDYVRCDRNDNGIQDADDPTFPDVTVNLWTDDDGDGTPDTQIATTITDDDGLYLFEGLDPRLTYVVQFIKPDGFDWSDQDVGSDDAIDSDVDPATGVTGPIELDPGERDLTIDAGLVPLIAIGGASTGQLLAIALLALALGGALLAPWRRRSGTVNG